MEFSLVILSYWDQPGALIGLLVTLVVGLTLHEYAHAYVADRYGDPTPRMQGRLTLDPRDHIDPLGAIVFLIAGFGWAKPVQVDPYRLDRNEMLWVSLAGPASNFLLALFGGVVLRALTIGERVGLESVASLGVVASFFLIFTLFNLILMLFNLLPVAPLDGWKVLLGLVPNDWVWRLRRVEQYGMLILLFIVFAPDLLNLGWDPLRAAVFDPAMWLLRRIVGA